MKKSALQNVVSRSRRSESISVQSFQLIEAAFALLYLKALPVYTLFSGRQRPPISGPENANSSAAIVLLTAGLDSHLCRLKYLHDVAPRQRSESNRSPLPFRLDDALSIKIMHLMTKKRDVKLKEELIEITICRDIIVHPKIYLEERTYQKWEITKMTSRLASGIQLRQKQLDHMLKRLPLTRRLRLNLVPTWISYVDAVVCILVINRFLKLLQSRYGFPYAYIGPVFADPDEIRALFRGWNFEESEPDRLADWSAAFYKSLSQNDQIVVRRVLRGTFSRYLQ